ncbi:Ig-like domain-containing protein [Marinobacterium sp. YM272]|uniref:Ig-like domain-containing protein n=1 Tax=Marinobacterium sp. YM272 TaxID=3421654 RepID=UPI003D7FED50
MRLAGPTLVRSIAVTALSAAIASVALPSFAADVHGHSQSLPAAASATAEQARQQALEHTQALLNLQKKWAKAQGADKSRALEQLTAKAEERRAFLLELMESNPAAVLSATIPDDKQAGLPTQVLEKLEQRIDLEGKLEIFYEDYEDGSQKLHHVVNTAFGERFKLRFSGQLPHDKLTGSSIAMNGVFFESADEDSDGVVVFNQDDTTLSLAADNASYSSGSTVEPVANTFGEQRTAVILVNFQDNPTNQPATVAQTNDIVFGEVDQFIRENSYGQTWLSGDTFGWFTIPQSSTTCSTQTLETYAREEATARGINLSGYDRLVFIHPYTSACKWGGVGTVGGSPSKAFINGKFQLSTIAHELGHNLGLYHSHALSCGSASVGTACSSIEYGDIPDVMGTMVSGHFSAPQKERLGWLGYGSSPAIQTVETSGSYSLSPYSAQDGGVKALKFLKGIDPNTGNQEWYYVEYRQPVGFDSDLTKGGNFLQGATVRSAAPADGDSFHMLDMNAQTSDWWDSALEAGQQFVDELSGTTIATESLNSQTASIYVNAAAAQVCQQTDPSLILAPSDIQWAAAGANIQYSLTLSNNDTSACASNQYQLSNTLPSGWSSTLPTQAVTLEPGSSSTISFTITSPVDTAETFYGLDFAASSGSYSSTLSTMVVIEGQVDTGTTNSAPVAKNDGASTSYETPVTIAVLSNDSDPDGDALSITSVSGVNGQAKINANGTLTFTPATGFSGIETFTYSISDGQGGSSSASVSVSVAGSTSTTNQAPVASNDTGTTDGNTSVIIDVLANDSDPDGDTLTVTSVTQGSKGSVKINSNGTLTFTPAKSFKNGDSFDYTISDGNLSATATVTVSLASGSDSSGTSKGNGKGPNK